jgi:hypothetical protein
MRRIELTMVVLPTPGPPVMTSDLLASATPDRVALALGEFEAAGLLDPCDRLGGVDNGQGSGPRNGSTADPQRKAYLVASGRRASGPEIKALNLWSGEALCPRESNQRSFPSLTTDSP